MNAATFERLLNTTHYVLIVSDTSMRGQYDYSGLYCIDKDYIQEQVQDKREDEDDSSAVTAKEFSKYLRERDFGGGNWEWMHIYEKTRRMLDMLDKHSIVDLHADAVKQGFDDCNAIYIGGKDLAEVCAAGLAMLASVQDSEWKQGIVRALQEQRTTYF